MDHKFIHPIETRYRTEIAQLFTEEKKLQNWMLVESVLANIHAELGSIPKEAAKEIDKAREKVKLERVKQIDNENITTEEIMQEIKAPDFPTGGIICGTTNIKAAYKTGKGKIKLRANTNIEEKANKRSIIITEIPYMINKSLLIQEIANLVKEKKVYG